MPMSQSYKDRLFPILPQLAAHYGTPFHIYDEAGIRATGTALNQAFAGIPGFREYFAVKALPNRRILEALSELNSKGSASVFPLDLPDNTLLNQTKF